MTRFETDSKWERIFSVRLDRSYACISYQMDEPDNSIDRIFCFAAAHHFLAHRKTLREIGRVLRPRGTACYFYEPTTPNFLYPLAYRRVNRKRPEVPEDVLIALKIRDIALDLGFSMVIDRYPSTLCRGPVETMYYYMLCRMAVLQILLPCTANLIFTKPAS